MGLVLTGRPVSVREGLDWGFVNAITCDDVLAEAKRRAGNVLWCSLLAVRATKQAALRGVAASPPHAIPGCWTYPALAVTLASADAVVGPTAGA